MAVKLTVNDVAREIDAPEAKPLLWVLREELDLAGPKLGCGAGLCGACTVLLDGAAVRSCVTTLGDAAGATVTTIEHAASLATGKRLIDAWIALDVPQCGYCQAGQIMSAAALLSANPKPSDEEIQAAMNGNICRCSTYLRIRKAIRMAAGLPVEEAAS